MRICMHASPCTGTTPNDHIAFPSHEGFTYDNILHYQHLRHAYGEVLCSFSFPRPGLHSTAGPSRASRLTTNCSQCRGVTLRCTVLQTPSVLAGMFCPTMCLHAFVRANLHSTVCIGTALAWTALELFALELFALDSWPPGTYPIVATFLLNFAASTVNDGCFHPPTPPTTTGSGSTTSAMLPQNHRDVTGWTIT
jgi:hypothetical protein